MKNVDDYEDWISSFERREVELRQEMLRIGFPRESIDVFVEGQLQREMAEASGVEVEAIEAMTMVRKHGLRRARKVLTDVDYLGVIEKSGGEDSLERNRRILRCLDEYRAQLPWWRRLLG